MKYYKGCDVYEVYKECDVYVKHQIGEHEIVTTNKDTL